DFHVTGVQTCALPIYHRRAGVRRRAPWGVDGGLDLGFVHLDELGPLTARGVEQAERTQGGNVSRIDRERSLVGSKRRIGVAQRIARQVADAMQITEALARIGGGSRQT